MDSILKNQQKITAIPRKFHTYIKDIWVLQLKLHSRIGRQPYKTLKHPRFRAAYDFLLVREKAAAETKDLGFWWTDFQKNNEDLILVTGNYNNFFGKLFYSNKLKLFEKVIDKLKYFFTDRLYIEIQRHGEYQEKNFENYLLKISSSYNLPIIASQEVFYLNPEMAEAHDALLCIGEKQFIEDKNRFRYNNQHYLKKSDDIKNLYKDIPEALENNYNFPLRFNFKPKRSKPILPSISTSKNII